MMFNSAGDSLSREIGLDLENVILFEEVTCECKILYELSSWLKFLEAVDDLMLPCPS